MQEPESWFVSEVDERDDFGQGPVRLCIGPHEDDPCDAFAWMQDSDKGAESRAQLMAAAPALRHVAQLFVECDRAANSGGVSDADITSMYVRTLLAAKAALRRCGME
jgi:hypothetical protein